MTEHAPEYVQEEKIISFSLVMILLFTAQIQEKYGLISIILSREPQFERRIEPNRRQHEGSCRKVYVSRENYQLSVYANMFYFKKRAISQCKTRRLH